MADVNPSIPAVGELNSTADPKIRTALNTLVATVNALEAANFSAGAVDTTALLDDAVTAEKLDPTTVGAILGIGQSGTVRRGKCIVATEEARTNASYGTLTTPDQVAGIVVPTDGLLAIQYDATWKSSAVAARAAIFLGSDQLKIADGSGYAPATQAGVSHASAITWETPLITTPAGLAGGYATAARSEVTTGQVLGIASAYSNPPAAQHEVGGSVLGIGPSSGGGMIAGGPVLVRVPAGTYTVSVQFKAASGTVTVKDRRLWVWTMGF
mgnify:CR=1 FL=1